MTESEMTLVSVSDDLAQEIVLAYDEKDVTLKVPDGYSIKDGSIYCSIKDGEQEICPHLVLPVCIYRDADTGNELIEVAFNHDGSWHRYVQPKAYLYSGKGIAELTGKGLTVFNATAKRKLCEFIQRTECMNRPSIPVKKVASHLGWNDTFTEFTPYSEDVIYHQTGKFGNQFNSVRSSKGTIDEWLELMKPLRSTQRVPERIALAASFASVLLKPTNSTAPFMVDIWGPAGTGKTTLLYAAASVWGYPDHDGGYISTFNATANANEQLAMFCCDLPLMLDEMETVRGKHTLETLVYNLCEGKPKGRATAAGGLQEQGGWRNTILLTGEHPIVEAGGKGGAQRRVVDLKCDHSLFGGDQAVIGRLRNRMSHCYGTAGRAFVEMLKQPGHIDKARMLLEQKKAALAAIAPDSVQLLPGALILTADALAEEWVFKDGIRLNDQDVADILKGGHDIDMNQQAYDSILAWIAVNNHHILSEGEKQGTAAVYGRYVRTSSNGLLCALLPDQLKSILERGGYNYTAFMDWAASKELVYEKDGKRSYKARFKFDTQTKLMHCVGIYIRDQATIQPTAIAG